MDIDKTYIEQDIDKMSVDELKEELAAFRSLRNRKILSDDSIEYESNTPYDDVYRTSINELPQLLIPLVNEIFGESFSDNAQITLSPNEHFINTSDTQTQKVIDDLTFSINEILGQKICLIDDKKSGRFIMECESSPSNDWVMVRVFEYAMKNGLDFDKEMSEGVLTVNIPRSAVIFLRSNGNTKDMMRIIIRTEEGEIGLPVHVLKMSSYSLDDIFEKRLYMLIPFYIFNFEKQFKTMEDDEGKRNELIQVIQSIGERLRSVAPREDESGKMVVNDDLVTTYTASSISRYIKTVARRLTRNYPKVQKGVDQVMGGRIFTYKEKEIHDDGIFKGENNMAELIKILCSLGRFDDVKKVSEDVEYRQKLYKEFNIGKELVS